jgi:alpha-glucosidase
MVPRISLGLERNDQGFRNDLRFIKAGRPVPIDEQYTVVHGKRSHCNNRANGVTVSFENAEGSKMELGPQLTSDQFESYRKIYEGEGGVAEMSDGSEVDVSRRKKEEFLQRLAKL